MQFIVEFACAAFLGLLLFSTKVMPTFLYFASYRRKVEEFSDDEDDSKFSQTKVTSAVM